MATKTLPTGTTITPVAADKLIIADASDGFRLKDLLISALQTLFSAELTMTGALVLNQETIADGDETPDVSGGNIFITEANTGATAISDLDLPTAGQIIVLIGGSNTNSSTIADSGNFTLSAAWTANDGDVLGLYVKADNDYIECFRSDN